MSTIYTNSPLVSYTKLSPNHSGTRTHSIDRITPHCVVGQCTLQSLGAVFYPESRKASSNYGISYDGKVGMFCLEKNRSKCSSSSANDQRAVTIEVASDTKKPYAMKTAAYNTLIDLCVDICQRNGKDILLWFDDKDTALNYEPKPNEMVLTVHRWFAATSCPGDWLYERMADLASQVSKRLKYEDSLVARYRVIAGRFISKICANEMIAALRATGFDATTHTHEDEILVQCGVYSKPKNAQNLVTRLRNAGFFAKIVEYREELNIFDNLLIESDAPAAPVAPEVVPEVTPEPEPAPEPEVKPEPEVPEVHAWQDGDKVKLRTGATAYDGTKLMSSVFDKVYVVKGTPTTDRVVVGTDTYILAAMNAKDLILVEAASDIKAAEPTVTITKGTKVTVKSGAKSYTGGNLASFVYKTTYVVMEEPKGDRVVIGNGTTVTAAVKLSDLEIAK